MKRRQVLPIGSPNIQPFFPECDDHNPGKSNDPFNSSSPKSPLGSSGPNSCKLLELWKLSCDQKGRLLSFSTCTAADHLERLPKTPNLILPTPNLFGIHSPPTPQPTTPTSCLPNHSQPYPPSIIAQPPAWVVHSDLSHESDRQVKSYVSPTSPQDEPANSPQGVLNHTAQSSCAPPSSPKPSTPVFDKVQDQHNSEIVPSASKPDQSPRLESNPPTLNTTSLNPFQDSVVKLPIQETSSLDLSDDARGLSNSTTLGLTLTDDSSQVPIPNLRGTKRSTPVPNYAKKRLKSSDLAALDAPTDEVSDLSSDPRPVQPSAPFDCLAIANHPKRLAVDFPIATPRPPRIEEAPETSPIPHPDLKLLPLASVIDSPRSKEIHRTLNLARVSTNSWKSIPSLNPELMQTIYRLKKSNQIKDLIMLHCQLGLANQSARKWPHHNWPAFNLIDIALGWMQYFPKVPFPEHVYNSDVTDVFRIIHATSGVYSILTKDYTPTGLTFGPLINFMRANVTERRPLVLDVSSNAAFNRVNVTGDSWSFNSLRHLQEAQTAGVIFMTQPQLLPPNHNRPELFVQTELTRPWRFPFRVALGTPVADFKIALLELNGCHRERIELAQLVLQGTQCTLCDTVGHQSIECSKTDAKLANILRVTRAQSQALILNLPSPSSIFVGAMNQLKEKPAGRFKMMIMRHCQIGLALQNRGEWTSNNWPPLDLAILRKGCPIVPDQQALKHPQVPRYYEILDSKTSPILCILKKDFTPLGQLYGPLIRCLRRLAAQNVLVPTIDRICLNPEEALFFKTNTVTMTLLQYLEAAQRDGIVILRRLRSPNTGLTEALVELTRAWYYRDRNHKDLVKHRHQLSMIPGPDLDSLSEYESVVSSTRCTLCESIGHLSIECPISRKNLIQQLFTRVFGETYQLVRPERFQVLRTESSN